MFIDKHKAHTSMLNIEDELQHRSENYMTARPVHATAIAMLDILEGVWLCSIHLVSYLGVIAQM